MNPLPGEPGGPLPHSVFQTQTKKSPMTAEQFIIGFIAFWVIMAVLLFVRGITVMLVWNWLMPDIFEFLPTLGFVEALAVSLVLGMFAPVMTMYIKKEFQPKPYESVGQIVLANLIVLLFGWIFNFFV